MFYVVGNQILIEEEATGWHISQSAIIGQNSRGKEELLGTKSKENLTAVQNPGLMSKSTGSIWEKPLLVTVYDTDAVPWTFMGVRLIDFNAFMIQ